MYRLKSVILYLHKNILSVLIISFLIAAVYSVLSVNYLYPLAIIIGLILYIFIDERIFVLISIIFFISAVGGEFQNFREVFTILSVSLLVYFFLKKFGLNFQHYPRPPLSVILLSFLILFTIAFSSILSGLHLESILALFRAVLFLLVCYLFYSFLYEGEYYKNIFYLISGFFLSSLLLSISVYYDLVSSGFYLFVSNILITRWAGLFGNPNTLAQLMSINIIFLIVLFYTTRIPKKVKYFVIPTLLLNFVIVLVLTNSRAAILGLIVSTLFLFYKLHKKIIIYIVSFMLLILLLYIIDPFTQSLIDTYLRLETISQRDYLWRAGLDIISDNPIFGVGPELYPRVFYSYIPTSGSYFFNLYIILQKPHPHNFILWWMAENGVLGGITALSIFVNYFYMAYKLMRANNSRISDEFLFAIGLFAIGILIFIRSFFEVEGIFSYGFISRDLPFWLSYIILAYLYKSNFEVFQKGN